LGIAVAQLVQGQHAEAVHALLEVRQEAPE
jgi:hypothetical protein